jgi:hypothetical protein
MKAKLWPFEMYKRHQNEASQACLLNLAETPVLLRHGAGKSKVSQ